MIAARKRTGRGMRGAAAVEFAIVVPILLLLVLGIIDWGYYFFIESIIANCAREAARAGAIAPVGLEATRAQAALNDALAGGRLDPARAGVSFTQPTADTFRARVTYPVGSITGASLIPVPANALGQATMRH